jgi:hypothetical protein
VFQQQLLRWVLSLGHQQNKKRRLVGLLALPLLALMGIAQTRRRRV